MPERNERWCRTPRGLLLAATTRPGDKVQRHGGRIPSGGGVGPPFRGVPGWPTLRTSDRSQGAGAPTHAKLVNKRLSRWTLRLQGFPFTIVYRPGTANANADALSKQDWPTDAGTTCDSERPWTALTQRGGGGMWGTQSHRDTYREATEEHYNLNIDYVYVLTKNRMYLLGTNGQSRIVLGAPAQTSL